MRNLTGGVMLAVALALGGAACDSKITGTTTSTTPSTTVTEAFAGSLTAGGGVSFFFSTTSSGFLTATIRSLSPDSTQQVGLALGTWNGLTCNATIINDRAGQGITVSGNVSGAGNLCVRIFDSQGTVTTTTQFEIVTNVETMAPLFMEAGSARTPTPPLLLAVQRSRMSEVLTVIEGFPL